MTYFNINICHRRIAIALDIDVKLYRIGQSKIFFRSGVVAELEILRDQKLAEFVVLFQVLDSQNTFTLAFIGSCSRFFGSDALPTNA